MLLIVNWIEQLLYFASKHYSLQQSCSPYGTLRQWGWFRAAIIGLSIMFHFSLLTIQSCGVDIEDPTPPSPPKWVQKSLPEEWPERGIDAHESRGIYLEWQHNEEEYIIAYLVYRAEYYETIDSLGNYQQLARKEAETSPELSYVDNQAKINVVYYYRLRAEDFSANISEYSNSINYTIFLPVFLDTMEPNGITEELKIDRKLKWVVHPEMEMENYNLTILSMNGNLILRQVLNPTTYTGYFDDWRIPDSIELSIDEIYEWRIDMNASFDDGVERSGAESPWATFLYVGE